MTDQERIAQLAEEVERLRETIATMRASRAAEVEGEVRIALRALDTEGTALAQAAQLGRPGAGLALAEVRRIKDAIAHDRRARRAE